MQPKSNFNTNKAPYAINFGLKHNLIKLWDFVPRHDPSMRSSHLRYIVNYSRWKDYSLLGHEGCQLGGFTPSYILHTRAFETYLLGGYLPYRKDYKVIVFYM
jgi:hypothetical protein